MTLERVIEETLKKSRERAEEIRKRAEEEKQKILEEARREAERIRDSRRREAQERAKRLRIQELSSAKIEARRRILVLQKELLEKCYEEGLRALSELPEEKRREILRKLISEAEKHGSKIYSNEQEEKIVRELTDLEYGGHLRCAGGVIVESEDGGIRVDMTYDTIFTSIFESSMKEITSILFEDYEVGNKD